MYKTSSKKVLRNSIVQLSGKYKKYYTVSAHFTSHKQKKQTVFNGSPIQAMIRFQNRRAQPMSNF